VILCPEKQPKMDRGKALGVWCCTNPKETLEANFADKLAINQQLLGILGITKANSSG